MLDRVYNWKTAPVELITQAGTLPPPRKNRGGNRRKYQDIVCAFDIETTIVEKKYSVMYIWQFQIGLGATVVGRTWKEFQNFMRRVREALPETTYLVTYIHNASYEFQFLRGIYKFTSDEVFAIDLRKPVRFDMYGCIEFRCSYIHSNMSLDEYLKKMGVEHEKVKGFDYEKPRYPWTPLSDDELLYCINDVRGLVEAVMIEMRHDNDSLYTIPATSTGYVRRDVKNVMRSYPWKYVHGMLPDINTYHMLREAFRGGNTHCNRYYAGQAVPGVMSYDRSSSYPDVQCNCLFPIKRFHRVKGEVTLQKLKDLIVRRKKAVLFRVALGNIRLRDVYWGCPYIPSDKCRMLKNAVKDNGRILSADYLEITLTDVDWRIILSEYTFDGCSILDCAYSSYGRLPNRLVTQIEAYYTVKTALKGDVEHRIYYDKNKAKLNSIYGLTCQNPCKLAAKFKGSVWDFDRSETIEEILDKSNRRAYVPYQWGVWCSAHARFRLEEGIRLVSAGNIYPLDDPRFSDFVYCDTDSVKYIGNVDWSAYNAKRMADSEESRAYADDSKGIRHYMGVYEQDDGYPATFASRGAKKYVVQHPGGKLEVTIAGVNKRAGGEELEKHGGINAFLQDVFVFREAGGTKLVYNDRDRFMIRIDGHRLKVRECVAILPDIYTLQDTQEYADLLSQIGNIFPKFLLDIRGKRQ